ncbi:unnamed protein product [Nezara viridula]|uniref:Uncharacterized protein n=1 Tax=Nezara viridula TaxID=85310 RepID=A0A9P0H815_NEZVI|nr:unnamed protein product [Nezara viridula]
MSGKEVETNFCNCWSTLCHQKL